MFAYAKPEQKQAQNNTVQKKETEKKVAAPNQTGIPNGMKSRFENLSGFSFDDVSVHYNSDKPAQLQALAYTQGNQVYIGPGQEKHLEHELGHVIQQKQGIVKPTGEINNVKINDSPMLERTADNIAQFYSRSIRCADTNSAIEVIQRRIGFEFQTTWPIQRDGKKLPKNESIKQIGNVSILADDNGESDCSDIEFVTTPLINWDQVLDAYGNMLEVAYWLLEITEKSEYNDTETRNVIRKSDITFSATPQVTFGVSLSKIFEIAKAAKDYRTELGRPSGYVYPVKSPQTGTNPAMLKSRPKLHGLVELINSYITIYLGEERIPYPKSITDHFLLARTDFSTLLYFSALTENGEYEPISLETWLEFFDEDYFERALFPTIDHDEDDLDNREVIENITVRDWLVSIHEGCDLLDGTKNPDMESMGSMDRDIVVNQATMESETVGIFELRANQLPHYLFGNPSWSKYMANWYVELSELGYLPE